MAQIGDDTGDRWQLTASPVDAWHRVEQGASIGVARMPKHVTHRAGFHDLSSVHDANAIGYLRNNAQIMGDEEHGHTEIATQRADQIEDLRLHG